MLRVSPLLVLIHHSVLPMHVSLFDIMILVYSHLAAVASTSILNVTITKVASPSPTVAPPISTSSQLPITQQGKKDHAGAIAGGAIGGFSGIALAVVIVMLVLRRRRNKNRNLNDVAAIDTSEKPELHADDLKPNRKELQGTDGPRDTLAKKPTEVSEMAANEEVIRKAGLRELPSNEDVGQEMETTENEMAALDRLAASRSGEGEDSTTLASNATNSGTGAQQ